MALPFSRADLIRKFHNRLGGATNSELDCSYYPLKRHPGQEVSGVQTTSGLFRAIASEGTATENREHAFEFNLNCLTRWHRCDEFSETHAEGLGRL